MSSLARARSLRKPAGPTALPPPRERPGDPSHDPSRNASPSRLPTKPTSRPTSSARTIATTTTTGLARSASVRLNRPGSASSNASSSTTAPAVPKRSVSLTKKTTAAATAVPPARKDTHRYPPLSSATRPTSMVLRPTSAGSAASAPTATRRTTPTHARANSTAAIGTTSSSTARRPATQPPVVPQDRKSRSRPPSRDPTSSASSTTAAPATPKRRAVSAEKSAPTTPPKAADKPPRLQRSAFNTLQQRFSPAKPSTPRPPSPSKPSAAVAAAAETARQQAALLQLHLLHRDAGRVEEEWHASAKAKLGVRFRGLRDAHRALAEREAAAVAADNVEALQRWADTRGPPLDQGIRALDAAISGVWTMSEPGGKYARAVRRFERWLEHVMDLEEARDSGTIGLLVSSGRRHGSIGGTEESLFVPEMDPAWADDCASMARKLEGWQGQLEDAGGDELGLNSDKTTTTLGRMLDGASSLVAGMLAELVAMEEIREAALAREEDWIEAMNRDDDDDDMGPRAGAVWRAL